MRIIIDNVPKLTEPKQQELGQSILVGMYHAGIPVNGVKIEFETGSWVGDPAGQEGY